MLSPPISITFLLRFNANSGPEVLPLKWVFLVPLKWCVDDSESVLPVKVEGLFICSPSKVEGEWFVFSTCAAECGNVL